MKKATGFSLNFRDKKCQENRFWIDFKTTF